MREPHDAGAAQPRLSLRDAALQAPAKRRRTANTRHPRNGRGERDAQCTAAQRRAAYTRKVSEADAANHVFESVADLKGIDSVSVCSMPNNAAWMTSNKVVSAVPRTECCLLSMAQRR